MDKKNVLITGQSGFIGRHLYNYLRYFHKNYRLIAFKDEDFHNEVRLAELCRMADIIVHLAGVNRHENPDELYCLNIQLTEKLISACEAGKSKPHILFSSSIQENRNNAYGQSKKESRLMLINWAKKNNAAFTGLLIPNVFGPFGKPYYNSVISTFSYQLTHNETPHIDIDAELNLIYVQELVTVIEKLFREGHDKCIDAFPVQATARAKVSELLSKLEYFKDVYYTDGIIPELKSTFDIYLFNTFRSYIPLDKYFPRYYKRHTDDRGDFVEILRSFQGGQVSYSTTKPGVKRGDHFHTRKIERFAVIKGSALIRLRNIFTDEKFEYLISGDEPAFVDMPVWYTHNITNTGKDELITLFWINEFFNPDDPDTIYEEV